MVGAASPARQGKGARPYQQGNKRQNCRTICATNTECGMSKKTEQNDRRLMRAEICLFGVRHLGCAVSANPTVALGAG
jgi:hypothetical protein